MKLLSSVNSADMSHRINEVNRDNQYDMLMEILPIACGRCKDKYKKQGAWGLWHCWFINESRMEQQRMMNVFDKEEDINIAF